MSRKGGSYIIMVSCAFLIAVGVLITGSDPFCSERDPDKRQIGPTKTAEVTIQRKMRESFLTKELQRVIVSKHTEFFDQSGRKIEYGSFSAPCIAVLVYEPEPKGDPLAVSVSVKKFLPGATSLHVPIPE